MKVELQTNIKIKYSNFKATLKFNLFFKFFNLYESITLINYKLYLEEADNLINKMGYILIFLIVGQSIGNDVDIDV